MVNTFLIVISIVSLVLWFLQEKLSRPQIRANLDNCIADNASLAADDLLRKTLPDWSQWLFRAISMMWLCWGAAVFLLKDGDFALVLVWLTLFSGVVAGLDHFLFTAARNTYMQSKAVVDYLAKYTEEQRQGLQAAFGKELVVAEYSKSFFPVLLVVMILRSFIVEPFQIPSASMVPTLQVGDYILVNKFNYGLRLPVLGTKILEVDEPARGDVMVFFPPHDNRYFIKRVIGLPGDEISYRDKVLTINGETVEQQFLAELLPDARTGRSVRLYQEDQDGVSYTVHNTKGINRGDFSVTVKPGHYFMMGDNRDNSSDSRVWGQVPEKNIVGQAFARWMYWPSIKQLPSFSRVGEIH